MVTDTFVSQLGFLEGKLRAAANRAEHRGMVVFCEELRDTAARCAEYRRAVAHGASDVDAIGPVETDADLTPSPRSA